jgi:hypothetical protein
VEQVAKCSNAVGEEPEMALKLDIEMRRGDTRTVRGFLQDGITKQPIDDPTAQWKLTARTRRDATDAVFEVSSSSQFVAGEGRCTIAPGDTNSFTRDRVLYYDMQVRETSGTVTTLLEGKLYVYMDSARTA